LPEDAKQRTTEAFDKLKKDLATERERRVRLEQTLQVPQQQQTQQQPESDSPYPEYYNPETGEVDVVKLNQREQQFQQQIQQLEQRTNTIAKAEQVKQEQETYSAYPELNPSGEKFDQAFHDAVSGALTAAYLRGETPTFKSVADNVAEFAGKQAKKAEKAGATKALEELSPKEQAAMEATGRSDRRTETQQPLEDLQKKTREGNLDAIIERMKNVPAV
jgi:hypothetical protein